MLTIKEFRAKYVRTFADLHVKFKTGTIGIFGPNGSGKSTLLNLMRGGLTNDFKTFYGTRERMVSDFAGKHDASYIELLIQIQGTQALIRRSFPKGNSLIIGNDKAITREEDIAAALAALGLNPELISLAAFIPQNKIAQFMSATDTERAKAYQVLVSAEFLEQVWKRLGNYITAKQQLLEKFTDTSEALIEQNTALTEDLSAAETKLEEAQSSEELWNDEQLSEARKRLASIESAQTLKKQAIQSRKALEAAEQAQQEAEAKLAEVQKKTGKFEVDELVTQLEQHRKVFKQWRSWKQYQDALNYAIAKRNDIRKERDAVIREEKALEPVEGNVRELTEKIGALTASIKADRSKLETWKKRKVGECDACGQSITAERLSKQLDELDDRIKESEVLLGKCRTRLNKVTAFQTARDDLSRRRNQVKLAIPEWNASKKKLPAKVEKPETIAARKERKLAFAEALKNLKQVRGQAKALREAKEAVSEAKAACQSARIARDNAKARYAPVKELLEDGAKEKLENEIEEQEKSRKTITQLEADIKSIQTQIDKNNATIDRTAVERARHLRDKDSVEILQTVRARLHRDSLPRTLAEKAQAFLTEGINERLERYGDKFWAEPGEDLSFMLNFPDREPKNSAELSIGQQVILALSFWDTVADFFGLGIQAFDEPTANLDVENIGYLRDALTVMTDASRGRRQVFVVSHEAALKSSFQQVIEL